ncbi:hypothetical protein DVH05_011467 [Phytophthora capsici]|nr:hypothetical protein DVH05_011467 [Phytophthora capsici]
MEVCWELETGYGFVGGSTAQGCYCRTTLLVRDGSGAELGLLGAAGRVGAHGHFGRAPLDVEAGQGEVREVVQS